MSGVPRILISSYDRYQEERWMKAKGKTAPPRNLPLLTEAEVEERRPILLSGIQQYNDGG